MAPSEERLNEERLFRKSVAIIIDGRFCLAAIFPGT